MPPTKKVFIISASSLIFTILITSCAVIPFGTADCIWNRKALAWIDENGNGKRDQNEQPLANVNIFVDDVRNNYRKVGDGAATNGKGETHLSVWLPGCPNIDFEVYPETPVGYHSTTPPRLKADVGRLDQVFEFGFDYLPNVPTVTPVLP